MARDLPRRVEAFIKGRKVPVNSHTIAEHFDICYAYVNLLVRPLIRDNAIKVIYVGRTRYFTAS